MILKEYQIILYYSKLLSCFKYSNTFQNNFPNLENLNFVHDSDDARFYCQDEDDMPILVKLKKLVVYFDRIQEEEQYSSFFIL